MQMQLYIMVTYIILIVFMYIVTETLTTTHSPSVLQPGKKYANLRMSY